MGFGFQDTVVEMACVWDKPHCTCVQWNCSVVDTLGDIVKCPVMRGVPGKFLFRKHIWVTVKCPEYRGVLISECPLREVTLTDLYCDSIVCKTLHTEHSFFRVQ